MISKKLLILVVVIFCFATALPHSVQAETAEESLKKQLILNLDEKLKSLQAQLIELQGTKISTSTEPISIVLKSSSANFKRLRHIHGTDAAGEGKYMLKVEITAGKDALYIPVSITTGRKSNGLIYQVEGSERATSTATVTCNGEDSLIVTSGTLSYCKVPAGKTVNFKVLVTIVGPLREEYRVALGRINYKLNTNDSRYKKFLTDIHTKLLKFR